MNKVKITLHHREHKFVTKIRNAIGKNVVGKFEPEFESDCWSWKVFNSVGRIIEDWGQSLCHIGSSAWNGGSGFESKIKHFFEFNIKLIWRKLILKAVQIGKQSSDTLYLEACLGMEHCNCEKNYTKNCKINGLISYKSYN